MDPREKVMGRTVAQQLGHQYVNMAEQLLAQGLGRQHSDQELEEFCLTAVSLLAGSMYAIMRDRTGPKESEAWLRRTLAMTSSVVRLRGSDAMLNFNLEVKEVANTKNRRQPAQPEPKAVPAQPPPPCACKKDADGRCAECGGKLAGALREIVKKMTDAAKDAKTKKDLGTCRECDVAQMDYAISLLVPDLVTMEAESEAMPNIAQEVLTVLYQMASAAGVREFPLTDKAMNDVEAKTAKSGS